MATCTSCGDYIVDMYAPFRDCKCTQKTEKIYEGREGFVVVENGNFFPLVGIRAYQSYVLSMSKELEAMLDGNGKVVGVFHIRHGHNVEGVKREVAKNPPFKLASWVRRGKW